MERMEVVLHQYLSTNLSLFWSAAMSAAPDLRAIMVHVRISVQHTTACPSPRLHPMDSRLARTLFGNVQRYLAVDFHQRRGGP